MLVVVAAIVAWIAATGPGHTSSTAAGGPRSAAMGKPAPAGSFTTVTGRTLDVTALRGHPTLLWFVATWCPACQSGTRAVARHLDELEAHGVRVVELELFDNLGQPGPSVAELARSYGGARYGDPHWILGTASARLTRAYDPRAYLDIYYLLDARGRVRFVGSSPAATMPAILDRARSLS